MLPSGGIPVTMADANFRRLLTRSGWRCSQLTSPSAHALGIAQLARATAFHCHSPTPPPLHPYPHYIRIPAFPDISAGLSTGLISLTPAITPHHRPLYTASPVCNRRYLRTPLFAIQPVPCICRQLVHLVVTSGSHACAVGGLFHDTPAGRYYDASNSQEISKSSCRRRHIRCEIAPSLEHVRCNVLFRVRSPPNG